MKKALSIGLRLLGLALVVFVLWRIQYRDVLVRDGGDPVVGTVVEAVDADDAPEETRSWFEPSDGGERIRLPDDWRKGARDGMEVKLGLFAIVGESDKLLLAIFALLYGPITLISITRWWYLLRRVGIPIPYGVAFRLTFVGFFFNSAVPGLTGGDLVKAFYIAREARGARVRAVMSVLVDRAIGLFALGVLSALILIPNLGNPAFRSASLIVFLFLAGCTVFGAVFLSQRLRRLVRLESIIKKLPFSGFFAEVDQGIVIYRKVPGAVLGALLLSLLNHFTLVVMAIGLGRAIGIDIPVSQYFVFVPVCMMMASVPLLPGGWGVREAAFAGFFGLVGVAATEAIALSILIGLTQLLWSLLGGIFFLLQPERASSKDLADFSSKVEAEVERAPSAGS